MSSETPARRTWPASVSSTARWRIERCGPDAVSDLAFIAAERSTGRRVVAGMLTELETSLIAQAQWGQPRD